MTEKVCQPLGFISYFLFMKYDQEILMLLISIFYNKRGLCQLCRE